MPDKSLAISVLGIDGTTSTVLAGILLSHTSHWLSVIHLWVLTGTLTTQPMNRQDYLAFTVAVLHIISPAGVFLSAPDAESAFSFLSLSGFVSFVSAIQHFDQAQVSTGFSDMIHAGLRFSAATVVRSNGILAGIPFLIEAIIGGLSVLSQGLSRLRVIRLASVIAGGIFVGIGLFYPQFLAYEEYCYDRSPDERRTWCNELLPSIFTFVQSHYW